MKRVAVIGAGLIGKERLDAVAALRRAGRDVGLVGIFDADLVTCQAAAEKYATTALSSVEAVIATRADWTMIALPHDIAVTVAEQVLRSGGRVLLEKPMGRDLVEAQRLLELGGDRLKIGFNYRFYRGIEKAVADVQSGRLGKIVSIEFELGHGCAPGQEKTWKLNAERAGGGCLIDPGVHLLDLCLRLAPDGLKPIGGASWSGFWNTGIEEEVSLILDAGAFCMKVRVSVVAWRSTFHMRINGTEGYATVSGRNRSYGPQTYVVGKRWGWRDAPSQVASEVMEVNDDGLDVFERETEALLFPEDSRSAWPAIATAAEGFAVMKLLDDVRATLNLRRGY
ncbi:Predicted dehydrogenase [Bryocella elongata]|uniref:Predicted dehydrogenase n=1 Tax=Bryocella elongata TaxID=863522 RepID=A0A1H5SPP5_9BACT|nr:Gfo/Idh/MocA family oxidoreductase [Bryocella elongata]SEF52539.1 Predicted dehydrogenase [Bryocella elongata]